MTEQLDLFEEWRPVVGWEGLYEVSSLGRVRSMPRTHSMPNGGFRTTRPRVMTPQRTGRTSSYLWVALVRGRRREPRMVHHLVLEAFVGPRPAGAEALHGPNHDPSDNRAENLSWGSHVENIAERDRIRAEMGLPAWCGMIP